MSTNAIKLMILYNFANGRALRVECETSKMEVCENLTFKFVLQFEIFLVKLFSFLGFLGLACFEYVRLLGARKQASVTLPVIRRYLSTRCCVKGK